MSSPAPAPGAVAAPGRTGGTGGAGVPTALLVASHPGPAAAVTTVVALLAWSAGLDLRTAVTVTAAVLAGQLTIGWVNDLRDAGRDRATGRTDKPLATGALPAGAVVVALAVAGVACVVLSLAAGWRSGVVHLLLGVGSGHAYNLALKATALSPLPYAVAFGTLPAVVQLAGDDPSWPPWWMPAAGAALGVGAHLLNALPDLDDDVRTGVRGMPHRLGRAWSRVLAALLLVGASALAALGPAGAPPVATAVALVTVLALAVVAVVGRGRQPFRAAMAIALLDVALLVAAG